MTISKSTCGFGIKVSFRSSSVIEGYRGSCCWAAAHLRSGRTESGRCSPAAPWPRGSSSRTPCSAHKHGSLCPRSPSCKTFSWPGDRSREEPLLWPRAHFFSCKQTSACCGPSVFSVPLANRSACISSGSVCFRARSCCISICRLALCSSCRAQETQVGGLDPLTVGWTWIYYQMCPKDAIIKRPWNPREGLRSRASSTNDNMMIERNQWQPHRVKPADLPGLHLMICPGYTWWFTRVTYTC